MVKWILRWKKILECKHNQWMNQIILYTQYLKKKRLFKIFARFRNPEKVETFWFFQKKSNLWRVNREYLSLYSGLLCNNNNKKYVLSKKGETYYWLDKDFLCWDQCRTYLCQNLWECTVSGQTPHYPCQWLISLRLGTLELSPPEWYTSTRGCWTQGSCHWRLGCLQSHQRWKLPLCHPEKKFHVRCIIKMLGIFLHKLKCGCFYGIKYHFNIEVVKNISKISVVEKKLELNILAPKFCLKIRQNITKLLINTCKEHILSLKFKPKTLIARFLLFLVGTKNFHERRKHYWTYS